MSTRKVIAVDIDDVIAAHAEAFVTFSNARWDTHLTIKDYEDHWTEIWRVEHAEAVRRANEYHRSGNFSRYKVINDAKEALDLLKTRFDLVVVTGRPETVSEETEEWLDKYYASVFSGVHFVELWSSVGEHLEHTKPLVLKQIGADYLVDDQISHCVDASEAGIKAVLFGNYPWNQLPSSGLPKGITRATDWDRVLRYFNDEAGKL